MTILEKTPCASATLRYFGVVGTTWNNRTCRNVWLDTLRRGGYAARSRKSKLAKKEKTVGAARTKIAKIAAIEPEIIAFVVQVQGHVYVLDRTGRTAVDTAPRKKDKRVIKNIYAIMRK